MFEELEEWESLEGSRMGPGWKHKETGDVFFFFNPMFAATFYYRGIYKKRKENGELSEGETIFETEEGREDAKEKAKRFLESERGDN